MRILGQLFAFAPHISMGQVNKLIFHIFFGPTLQRLSCPGVCFLWLPKG